MFIQCSSCGKCVSSQFHQIGDEFYVRAYVECPECLEKNTDLHMSYGLRKELADLNEELAKLRTAIAYAVDLLDGNEDESASPSGELADKLIEHLNHYEDVKSELAQLREQLAKAESEAKRYREAWSDVRDALIIDREFWNNKNANREVQISSTILRMDDLILSSEDHP